MEELTNNIKNENLQEIYDTYIKIKNLIDELNSSKKDLPPKEEI